MLMVITDGFFEIKLNVVYFVVSGCVNSNIHLCNSSSDNENNVVVASRENDVIN